MQDQVKRNRTLASNVSWLLDVAAALKGGRLEIEPIRAFRIKRNEHVTRVRAILMHEESGVAMQGVGKNATEATNELIAAIERDVSRRQRDNA